MLLAMLCYANPTWLTVMPSCVISLLITRLFNEAQGTVLLVAVSLVHAGPIFEGVDKAGDVVGGDGDDEGVGDDRQHPDALQDPVPDTWRRRPQVRVCVTGLDLTFIYHAFSTFSFAFDFYMTYVHKHTSAKL